MNRLYRLILPILFLLPALQACREAPTAIENTTPLVSPLKAYVSKIDPAFEYAMVDTLPGEGYTMYVIRMVSQRWLTEAEVKDPVWWHWLTVVVPDNADPKTGLLFIGGGNRNREQPKEPDELTLQAALASQSVVAELHNVPNQEVEFVGDTYGPRVEDELIAYGWRKFLEGGAKDEDIPWLARMPMTTAAVRALDVLQAFSKETLNNRLERFVVAGGSKRGWTTWTTGAVDDRVVAIAPIVIDVLNVEPSFDHHWRAYGRWAPAVGNYEYEGIMEWQGSKEYARLLSLTDPYAFKDQLAKPKLLLNATGDQFFLPDSWQFYWDSLPGEKHMRYVPNSEHSMRETDALESLISFHQMIVADQERPDFDWKVENGEIIIKTDPGFPPESITLWQANNPKARNFQVDSIGRAYQASPVLLREDGQYRIRVNSPEAGWTAFYAEITFPGMTSIPLKMTTGVVVTPDTYPFEPFVSEDPKGTPE